MQKSLFENEKMSDALQPALQQCSVSCSTLLFGDCLIESDKIESGSVDLILTDLPYGTMKGRDYSKQPNHTAQFHVRFVAVAFGQRGCIPLVRVAFHSGTPAAVLQLRKRMATPTVMSWRAGCCCLCFLLPLGTISRISFCNFIPILL